MTQDPAEDAWRGMGVTASVSVVVCASCLRPKGEPHADHCPTLQQDRSRFRGRWPP